MLAQSGASIVLSDLMLNKAQAVADEIISNGGKAIAVVCNVLKDEDLVNKTVAKFVTVNILVNNAGGGIQTLD
ncbi:SDR family NAD(P)-dependent oxidoreductase [Bacteroides sp.]|uniref:SDR family NAD(P)-dependent oxidoreductase n=1 Tax=Bacteroides sp. TaxID=29523 RepID=UPI00260DF55D|nr:SDR family NAD(P)-dependent oxidoreductase [Bacteroides sp.]MDD3040690.1 SDR family NAD(P)-dependent oxidoreductase [Bacteroides sp.]